MTKSFWSFRATLKTMHHEETRTDWSDQVLYWDDNRQTNKLPYGENGTRQGVTWTREQTRVVSEILKSNSTEYYSSTGTQFVPRRCTTRSSMVRVWLGDGSSSACKITTDDKEILEYITTIADTYGMQVKQQTYAHRLHHKWKCCLVWVVLP
jgi:hypothetical protein